ncbi:MAG: GerMN domain-containing protein [Eubacteriales bacterium]|nr:GerMN domain-containing protein [Eubacteriales bacterium]
MPSHKKNFLLFFIILLLLLPFFVFTSHADRYEHCTLYFRFKNSALLGAEERKIFVPADSSFETELIKTLIEGPSSVLPYFSPLFPDNTQVINTWGNKDVLFVTFNDKLLDRYSDEIVRFDEQYKSHEGNLRRRLAMASLACTVTENTSFSYVQVLIQGDVGANTSMRLSESYFLQDSANLVPPIARDESYIMQAKNSVEFFIKALDRGDFSEATDWLAPSALIPDFNALKLPVVAEYTLSHGTVSFDGAQAIVLFDAALQNTDGIVKEVSSLPIRLKNINGIWKIDYKSIANILEESI